MNARQLNNYKYCVQSKQISEHGGKVSCPETVSNIYIQIYPDNPQPHWKQRKSKQSLNMLYMTKFFFS